MTCIVTYIRFGVAFTIFECGLLLLSIDYLECFQFVVFGAFSDCVSFFNYNNSM